MSRTFANMVIRMAFDNQFSDANNEEQVNAARAALRARTRAKLSGQPHVARGVLFK
jgi:hypothetical protein